MPNAPESTKRFGTDNNRTMMDKPAGYRLLSFSRFGIFTHLNALTGFPANKN
ncbi:MAG TPA: hypothetical protein VK400_19505 [Pyrinomonadaceae bacterium]|nr:hypothetical protein [Pyrinomonadaceae bacterium]